MTTHDTTPLEADLLDRYLAGACSAEEVARVERWTARSADRRAVLDALCAMRGRAADAPTGWDVDAGWRAFVDEIRGGASAVTDPRLRGAGRQFLAATPRRAPLARRLVAGALATVSLAAAAWFVAAHPSAPTPAAARVIATARGQRSAVTLADGTRLLLNAETRVRVPVDVVRDPAVEVVRGEVQFSVPHAAARRFVVRAGGARVSVLGTTFTVRRYAEDRGVRVVVTDGRVSLRGSEGASSREAVLAAGMVGVAADSGTPSVATPHDLAPYLDWTRGRLVLRDTPLRDALPELERRYGLTIRLADTSVADRPLTADVSDAGPAEILTIIGKALGLRYTREGNTVTFFRATRPAARVRRSFTERSETNYGK